MRTRPRIAMGVGSPRAWAGAPARAIPNDSIVISTDRRASSRTPRLSKASMGRRFARSSAANVLDWHANSSNGITNHVAWPRPHNARVQLQGDRVGAVLPGGDYTPPWQLQRFVRRRRAVMQTARARRSAPRPPSPAPRRSTVWHAALVAPRRSGPPAVGSGSPAQARHRAPR